MIKITRETRERRVVIFNLGLLPDFFILFLAASIISYIVRVYNNLPTTSSETFPFLQSLSTRFSLGVTTYHFAIRYLRDSFFEGIV